MPTSIETHRGLISGDGILHYSGKMIGSQVAAMVAGILNSLNGGFMMSQMERKLFLNQLFAMAQKDRNSLIRSNKDETLEENIIRVLFRNFYFHDDIQAAIKLWDILTEK